MKLDASLYGPVFPPGHFSRAPYPAKISDRPSIFHNNNIIKLKLLGMCVAIQKWMRHICINFTVSRGNGVFF